MRQAKPTAPILASLPTFKRLCIVLRYIALNRATDWAAASLNNAVKALEGSKPKVTRTNLQKELAAAKTWRKRGYSEELYTRNRNGITEATTYADYLYDTFWPVVSPYLQALREPGLLAPVPHVLVSVICENIHARTLLPKFIAGFSADREAKRKTIPSLPVVSFSVHEAGTINQAMDHLRDDTSAAFALHVDRQNAKDDPAIRSWLHITAETMDVSLSDVVVFKKKPRRKWHNALDNHQGDSLSLDALRRCPLAFVDYRDRASDSYATSDAVPRVRVDSMGALLHLIRTGHFAGILQSWIPTVGEDWTDWLRIRRVDIGLPPLRLSIYKRAKPELHGVHEDFYGYVKKRLQHEANNALRFDKEGWAI